MPKLVAAGRALPALKLIVLDPVVAAVTGDSHKNTETRRGLQPVVDLAAELDCAVLGITHLSKGTSGREPLERVAGSIAFGAVARIVLATVKSTDPNVPRRLVRAKSNLGPDTGGFEYTLFGAPVPGHDFHAQRVELSLGLRSWPGPPWSPHRGNRGPSCRSRQARRRAGDGSQEQAAQRVGCSLLPRQAGGGSY